MRKLRQLLINSPYHPLSRGGRNDCHNFPRQELFKNSAVLRKVWSRIATPHRTWILRKRKTDEANSAFLAFGLRCCGDDGSAPGRTESVDRRFPRKSDK